METIIQEINKNEYNGIVLDRAAGIIRAGGLVAFPTETVYGLGGNAMDAEASKKIYEAKGRPSDNPLIIHVSDFKDLETLTYEIPGKAKQLADAFWPGPLTMIFKKSDKVPLSTTGGLDTVAVRIPQHPVALALIRCSGVGIAAPSANTSGRPSPTMAKHVIDDMLGKIDMIIDGGTVGIGLESTIIDMTGKVPMILRPGYITRKMIESVIGSVEVDPAVLGLKPDAELIPKAPGMKYRHYAPSGELTIFEGKTECVIREINRRTQKLLDIGGKVGIIATAETKTKYPYGIVKEIGSRLDEGSIARKLYAVLREFDDIGTEYILTESFASEELGHAIMNRLLKAAGYHIIKVDGGV